jgi:hypothetical protein
MREEAGADGRIGILTTLGALQFTAALECARSKRCLRYALKKIKMAAKAT